jgi:dihydropteroate synthase
MMIKNLKAGDFTLKLDPPLIMGVVNVTPDSFSDGGFFANAQQAISHAQRLIEAGADIVDIGGESSRPGAEPVPVGEELSRVLPVVREIARLGVPVSIDTTKPEVMRAAVDAGACMVNDIEALQGADTMRVVAQSRAAVCLMHMRGRPRDMQLNPQYADVVAEVSSFLKLRVESSMAAGIAADRIVIDPGFGFGKSAIHNVELLRRLGEFADLGQPLLVGLSRKATLGELTGRGVGDRLPASIAAALIAAQKGASILRVHDVVATRDALAVWSAVRR